MVVGVSWDDDKMLLKNGDTKNPPLLLLLLDGWLVLEPDAADVSVELPGLMAAVTFPNNNKKKQFWEFWFEKL